jgi:hypothetical protein
VEPRKRIVGGDEGPLRYARRVTVSWGYLSLACLLFLAGGLLIALAAYDGGAGAVFSFTSGGATRTTAAAASDGETGDVVGRGKTSSERQRTASTRSFQSFGMVALLLLSDCEADASSTDSHHAAEVLSGKCGWRKLSSVQRYTYMNDAVAAEVHSRTSPLARA